MKYSPNDMRKLGYWVTLAQSCGWWWPKRIVCIISNRPERVVMEPTNQARSLRLHCEDGPALRYRDGWEVHAWHGTNVPRDLIEVGWDAKRIVQEPNTEIRRCAIEKIGWPNYLHSLGVRPVHECDDPGNPGHRLELYDLPDVAQVFGPPVRLVVMENASLDRDGRRRTYAETVPADIQYADEAQAWQFDVPLDSYRAIARAT